MLSKLEKLSRFHVVEIDISAKVSKLVNKRGVCYQIRITTPCVELRRQLSREILSRSQNEILFFLVYVLSGLGSYPDFFLRS